MGYLRVLGLFTVIFTALFAPITLTGRLIAPGDGLRQGIPAFYAPISLWSDRLLAGFPVGADPTIQSFYPPHWLFMLVGSYNAFVVAAYIGAAFFTYGFVEHLTASRLAGLVSGLTFSMCGVMLGHAQFVTMVHTIVWLPLMLWAVESLRTRLTARWLAVGTLAVAAMALAGHAQMLSYSGIVVAAYVVVFLWRAPIGRGRFLLVAIALAALGFGLAALQLLPTAELAALGERGGRVDYASFTLKSFDPAHLVTMVLPLGFGGFAPAYAGLMTLILVVVALRHARLRGQVVFWTVVAIAAVALALGDHAPWSRMVYELPLLNRFRVPSRHLMELGFAIAVLAGIGLAALAEAQSRGRARVLAAAAVVAAGGGVGLWLTRQALLAAWAANGAAATDHPWSVPVLVVPLAVGLIGAGALCLWAGRPTSRGRVALLVAALLLDLASGDARERWRSRSPEKSALAVPELAIRTRPLLQPLAQRILPVLGGTGSDDDVKSNLSRLWDIDSASVYGPLLPDRVGRLLSMNSSGGLHGRPFRPGNRALDLMAVRFVTVPRERLRKFPQPPTGDGANWSLQAETAATLLYENVAAMPRAWLVAETRALSADEVLGSIHHSVLPDGSPFEPSSMALVEAAGGVVQNRVDPGRSVAITARGSGRIVLATRAQESAYLVLADLWYPGWQASVDGLRVDHYRTNYIFRGLPLGPGEHTVVFDYRPRVFYIGAAVSGLSLVLLAAAMGVVRRRPEPHAN